MGHVLVVDDDADVLVYVTRLLRERGHRVTCVALGESALELTRHVRPDIIVLDIELPDRTGYDVCKLLRQHAHSAEIPVVMMSGARAACADCHHGLSCGAVEYLTKPFASATFLHAVERHLATREMPH